MTREDIILLSQLAGFNWPDVSRTTIEERLERFAALVAAEKEQQMLRDGWRQCAKAQRTTQHCGLLDAAVKAEREACAKVCEDEAAEFRSQKEGYRDARYDWKEDAAMECSLAIRARGEVKP